MSLGAGAGGEGAGIAGVGAGGGGITGAAFAAAAGGGIFAMPARSDAPLCSGAFSGAPALTEGPCFFASMDSATALLTSSSVVPNMSGLVRANARTFAATSSSFAVVLPLSFANIASFCVFHFGSMSETRMCSAMLSTAMSSPVIGDTANFVASAPAPAAAALAFASAARTSGFLWSRTIFMPGAGPGGPVAATPSSIIAHSASSISTSPEASSPASPPRLDPDGSFTVSTGTSAPRSCAMMSRKLIGSGNSSSSPFSKSIVSTTEKSCQSISANASRSFSASSSAVRFAASAERSHSSRCNVRSSKTLLSSSVFSKASMIFGGFKTFTYASANLLNTECMECVCFRKLNSGFPCSRCRSCVTKSAPCLAANCAVSFMTSKSLLAIPSGTSTVNSSFRGATRTFCAAPPAVATTTVPVASFAAFAASVSFMATDASSPPSAYSLNPAIFDL